MEQLQVAGTRLRDFLMEVLLSESTEVAITAQPQPPGAAPEGAEEPFWVYTFSISDPDFSEKYGPRWEIKGSDREWVLQRLDAPDAPVFVIRSEDAVDTLLLFLGKVDGRFCARERIEEKGFAAHVDLVLQINHGSLELYQVKISAGEHTERYLSRKELAVLAGAVAKNRVISLKLDSCSLNGEDLAELFLAMRQNTSLEVLSLKDNELGSEFVAATLSALAKHPAIRYLNLAGNSLRSGSAEALAEFILANKTIESISLRRTGCDETLFRTYLLPALAKLDENGQDHSLEYLDFEENEWLHSCVHSGEPSAIVYWHQEFCKAAPVAAVPAATPTTLEFKTEAGYLVGSLSAQDFEPVVREKVRTRQEVKMLGLKIEDGSVKRTLGEKEVAVLVALLAENKIRRLSLDHCDLGDPLLVPVATALARDNHSLQSLSLKSNRLTADKDGAVQELCRALRSKLSAKKEQHPALEKLELAGNQFASPQNMNSIFNLIAFNTRLREIDLRDTGLTDELFKRYILPAFEGKVCAGNTSLTKLWVSNSEVDTSLQDALEEFLIDNEDAQLPAYKAEMGPDLDI